MTRNVLKTYEHPRGNSWYGHQGDQTHEYWRVWYQEYGITIESHIEVEAYQ